MKTADQDLHEAMAGSVENLLIIDLTWEDVEALARPTMAFVRRCVKVSLDSELGAFDARADENGISIAFEVADENANSVIETPHIDLVSILLADREFTDARSTSDLIAALEHTVERMKAEFFSRYGVALGDVEAIAAVDQGNCANARNTPWQYEKWSPGETECTRTLRDLDSRALTNLGSASLYPYDGD